MSIASTIVHLARHFDKLIAKRKQAKRLQNEIDLFYEPFHQILLRNNIDETYDFLMDHDYKYADLDDIELCQSFLCDYLLCKKEPEKVNIQASLDQLNQRITMKYELKHTEQNNA